MNKSWSKAIGPFMKFIVLFWCVFSCTSAFAQEYTGVISYDYLPDKIIQLHKVKRQEVYEYTTNKKGKTDSIFLFAENYIFDGNGNIVEVRKVNKKNTLLSQDTYTYNKLNQLTEKISAVDNQASNNFGFRIPIINYVFSYDSLGRIVYTLTNSPGSSTVKTLKNVYDDFGRLVKVLLKVNKEEFVTQNLLFYDSKGILAKIDFIEDRRDRDHSYNFEYNPEQNTRTVTIQYGDNIEFFEKIKYNNYKQIVTRTTTLEEDRRSVSTDKRQMIEKFIYNSNNTINSDIIYVDGTTSHFYKHFYFN